MRSTVYFVFVALSITTSFAAAHSQALFQGLSYPLSSRGWAIGSAVSGFPNDFGGVLLNPSILSRVQSTQFGINYTTFIADVHSSTGFFIFDTKFAIHHPECRIEGRGALIFQYINYGSFVERDEQGNELGNFFANDWSLSAVFGKLLTHKTGVGMSISYIKSEISSYKTDAIIGSLGLLYYHPPSELSIGLSYHNFGYILSRFMNKGGQAAGKLIIGLSKKLAHLPLTVALDGYTPYKNEVVFRFGGEFEFYNKVYLRLGSSTRRADLKSQSNLIDLFSGTSCGLGIELKEVQIDIAYLSFGSAGAISSFNLSKIF